jgi:hypothetical protein
MYLFESLLAKIENMRIIDLTIVKRCQGSTMDH